MMGGGLGLLWTFAIPEQLPMHFQPMGALLLNYYFHLGNQNVTRWILYNTDGLVRKC